MRPSMSIARSVHRVAHRSYSSASFPERKVAVLGAGDGIGQPLALLMKLNPFVSHLSLYNIVGTPGFAVDVSHINTRYEVKGYTGEEQLAQALEGADVVIILAEVPQKPGMTRDDLFNINPGIIKGLTTAIAKYCPNALINMISNPVNSMVLIAVEVLKKTGKHHSGAHSDEHHHHLWTVPPPFLTSRQAPSGKGKPCLGRTRWMIHQT